MEQRAPKKSAQPKRDWDSLPVDVDFLVDSGLLFQINLEFLHPLGIALTVKCDEKGNKTFGFRDSRQSPGDLLFDETTAAAGREKFDRFMRQHGRGLLARRKRAIGREQQDINPKD